MNKAKLNSVTKDNIDNIQFPLDDVLGDSLYYPASYLDGTPVRLWKMDVNSFVYVDIRTEKSDLMKEMQKNEAFKGYTIIADRDIKTNELLPKGYSPRLLKGIDKDRYLSTVEMSNINSSNTFASWYILERNRNLDDSHGTFRFSFLYIRGEGLATYQAIYVDNNILPKVICNIRPGTGFGGNMSYFNEYLFKLLHTHKKGLPLYYLQWHYRYRPIIEKPWNKVYKSIDNDLNYTIGKDYENNFSVTLFKKI